MAFPDGLPTIHYTEMPERPKDDPLYRESQTFRRELPRLLAEGHEGKWALIKGDEVVGIFDTLDQTHWAGVERFGLQPFIMQPIREWQPVIRTRRF